MTHDRDVLAFADFTIHIRSGELHCNGSVLHLQRQPFQVLAYLVQHSGEVVTREELRQLLWSKETFVDFDNNLNAAINKVREALGDSTQQPRFIETLPRRGYRFVAPVSEAVGKAAPDTRTSETSGAHSSDETIQPNAVRRWVAAAIIVACAVFGVLICVRWATPKIALALRLNQLQHLKVTPLTTLPGNVLSPSFSPDGSQIAFAWDGENNGEGYDLYVKSVGSETPLRLTHRPVPYLSARWSPDGSGIAVSEISGIYLIPPTGGPERQLASVSRLTPFATDMSWSPDGKHLAFIDRPQNPPSDVSLGLFILTVDTMERTPVQTGCDAALTPAYSPHGDYLAWVCADSMTSFSLNVQRLRDSKVVKLLQHSDFIGQPAWSSDGRRIVFCAPFQLGYLWEVSLDRPGFAQKLPVGHDVTDLAVSRAGERLAYVESVANVNIWRADLEESPPKVRKLIVSSRTQTSPSISPDGGSIAFESSRSGSDEIWVCDADGSNPIQLTRFGTRQTGTPRWSPDGKWIAFDSRLGGEANIYVIDPHGGPPQKLETDVHDNSMPSWSKDGQWIYFVNGDLVHGPSVWKVSSGGGHAVQVAQVPSRMPMESPDGKYIYFSRGVKLWRVATDGSAEQEVPGMPQLNLLGDETFPFGYGIYFMSHTGGDTYINFFNPTAKAVRRILKLEKPSAPWVGSMPVSSDGRWMLYSQLDESSSNLMMIENW